MVATVTVIWFWPMPSGALDNSRLGELLVNVMLFGLFAFPVNWILHGASSLFPTVVLQPVIPAAATNAVTTLALAFGRLKLVPAVVGTPAVMVVTAELRLPVFVARKLTLTTSVPPVKVTELGVTLPTLELDTVKGTVTVSPERSA